VGEFSYLYSYCVCITTHSKAVCGKLPLHSFFSKAFGFLGHYIRLSQSFVDLYMHILRVLLMILLLAGGMLLCIRRRIQNCALYGYFLTSNNMMNTIVTRPHFWWQSINDGTAQIAWAE
jgi:hypothetical protein